ncbi:MAG: SusC/RagA family TonB-linked outer membrane protein [Gemmatimonadaceae bacterium]
MQLYRSVRGLGAVAVALALSAALALAQGRARVAGRVTDEATKQPLLGVTVLIVGTSYGAQTNEEGRYVIANAPAGVFSVEARRIGYGARRTENVRAGRDSVTTLDFALSTSPLRLDDIVVSGTVDATSSLKVPFTIAKLDGEKDIPVAPSQNAVAAIQGKVAGVHMGRVGTPGQDPLIQLRSPASQFKSTTPLYIVDGVILNSTVVNPLQDINPDDIASIEVLKGAAAASLYGSRAANGVIAVTTKRGNELALGKTQFSVRSEYGFSEQAETYAKPRYHRFLANEAGDYVDRNGAVVARTQRVLDPNGFMDNPYTGTLYDHAGLFFRPGTFWTATATLAQNSAATNFAVSFTRTREAGVVEGSDGLTRQFAKLTLDHRFRDDFSVSLSGQHSRAYEDPNVASFADFFRIDPDVDLEQTNPDGTLRVLPDTLSSLVNPLYIQQRNDNITRRARTLLAGSATYRPLSWLSLDGNLSYDRSDRNRTNYIARGWLTTDGQTPSLGSLYLTNDVVDGLNGWIGGTATGSFRDLTTRFTGRAIIERERNPYFDETGSEFSVRNVKDLSIATKYAGSSSFTDRRATSYLSSLTLDYAGKYIGDFLVRRDGSSLFGPRSRWNTYYRASGSYLLAEEAWWPFKSALPAFKLRYSLGTAGTRPDFSDQYANLETTTGGGLTRQSLGNPFLKPEIATEQEIGLDAIIKNRVSVSLVYAGLVSRDNIISAPLPGVIGFNTQEQNIGKTTGHTVEATIQAQLLNRGGFQWEMNVVADRSRNRVAEFNRACYTEGIIYRCEGITLGSQWGNAFIRGKNQLRPVHAGSQDAFDVNDDGWVVAVGTGNSWRDGVAKNLWGTTVTVDGKSYPWGHPILLRDSLDQTAFVQIGDANPDINYGIGNTFRYKGLDLYVGLTGVKGGTVYHNTRQTLYQSLDHPDVVQAGKPDERKKPTSYYTGQNGLSFNNSGYINHFIETGTYLKLNEMRVRYTLPGVFMRTVGRLGAERVSLDLIGRNLYTWTKYSGLNPEAVSTYAWNRIEFEVYPLYRTWTMGVNVAF